MKDKNKRRKLIAFTRQSTPLKACYILSYYFPAYVRSNTLIAALQQTPGIKVYTAVNTSTRIWRYGQTLIKLLHLRLRQKPDIYILGFRGYELYWLIRLLTIGKPLIYDHMMSPYDSLVHEKKLIRPKNLWGRFLYKYEKGILSNADLTLTDTTLHKKLFVDLFSLASNQIEVVPVGADESLFYPQSQSSQPNTQPFTVFFYSSFLPLHGVGVILEAAASLRRYPLQIILVGGHKRNLDQFHLTIKQQQLTNIIHYEWIDYQRLPVLIAQADLCLGGPFGNTGQAQRVITGKTYQFLAMAKPTVVGEVAGIHKYFEDKINCLLTPQGNPVALANAIHWAYENRDKLSKIGANGYQSYQSHFSIKRISHKLETILFQE